MYSSLIILFISSTFSCEAATLDYSNIAPWSVVYAVYPAVDSEPWDQTWKNQRSLTIPDKDAWCKECEKVRYNPNQGIWEITESKSWCKDCQEVSVNLNKGKTWENNDSKPWCQDCQKMNENKGVWDITKPWCKDCQSKENWNNRELKPWCNDCNNKDEWSSTESKPWCSNCQGKESWDDNESKLWSKLAVHSNVGDNVRLTPNENSKSQLWSQNHESWSKKIK